MKTCPPLLALITKALSIGALSVLRFAATADDVFGNSSTARPGSEPEDFGDLDLEELSRVLILSATLTPTQTRLVPAKTTVLDRSTIALSGARTLDELLEIHVPNTQLIAHNTHLDHFGVRGIISDRDDKYLLRVNGKVMNNRFFVGAESERDLPMLGDIRTVTVVSGPASATYGAGALAGVVNVETHNGLSFEGTDVRVRQGFWNEFVASEFRFGRKLAGDSGIFLYAAVADQDGSSQDSSPYVFGSSFATAGATPDVVGGEPVTFAVPRLRDGGESSKVKLHASYVNGPMEAWARYTQGGGVVRAQRTVVQVADAATLALGRRDLDRQFTASLKYKEDLSATFNLETFLSYSWYQHLLWLYDLYPEADDRQEHEAYGRVLGTWTPDEKQSVALGLEYSRMWFDGAPLGFGPSPGARPLLDEWETDAVSVLAEHQWRIDERWTTFASARLDKHVYTPWMFSPRLAVAYAPSAEDTYKLIVGRAARRNGDGELRQEHVQTGGEGTIETLNSLELRFERQDSESLRYGVSVYVEENEAIGFDAGANHSTAVGVFELWGLEAELAYRSEKTGLSLSHGYTKLHDASLATPTTIQAVSVKPYGFGDDLANWANHITKLAWTRELDESWSASSSLRVYWGYPGAEDLAAWNGSLDAPTSFALADPGYDEAFGASVYWNAGLEFRPTERLTLRADAYNILGWFDETLNKRGYYFRGSEYSVEAASMALSAKLEF